MAGVFGSAKLSKHVEINLDSPFIVFYGDQHEAVPVELTGTLILNAADYMNIRSVKIKLEGKWKIQWSVSGTAAVSMGANSNGGQAMIRDSGTLIEDEQILHPSSTSITSTTHRIAPGRHEWRFKFTLDPSLPESVEGLSSGYVVYDLTAEIDRGYMSKGLMAKKHVRIIRTLSRDMTETVPFPYSNEDTWTDKVKYKIYIPSRYYVFGTSIPVEFTLFPLRKGVRIGKIKMEVLERVGMETSKQGDQTFATTLPDKVVASVEQRHLPENLTLIEQSSGIADDSYHFKVTLPLKKSLNSCRQSVNTPHLKVHHNLKIFVNIHNPDGHVSQLCLRNLIHIYISPHMHINEDQSVSSNHFAAQTIQTSETGDLFLDAPPTYGTHILDKLYDDIDPSGFASGLATPMNFSSNNASSDNLALIFGNNTSQYGLGLLGDGAHSGGESSRSSSSIPDAAAVQLQARLAALEGRRPSISSVIDIPVEDSAHNSPRLAPADAAANSSPPSLGTTPPQHSDFPPFLTTRTASSSLLPIAAGNRSRTHSTRNSISLPVGGLQTPPLPSSSASQSFAFASAAQGSNSSSLRTTQNRNAPPAPFDLSALQRTPSYATAIRTPPIGVSFEGTGDVLPSYEESEQQEVPDHEVGHTGLNILTNDEVTEIAPTESTGPATVFDSNSDRLTSRRPHSHYLAPPIHRGGGADIRPLSGSSLVVPQRAHVRGRSLGRIGDLNSAPTSLQPKPRRQSHSRLRSEVVPSPIDVERPSLDASSNIAPPSMADSITEGPISDTPVGSGLQRHIKPIMGGGSLAGLWARRGSH